jgi:hypothetical protein
MLSVPCRAQVRVLVPPVVKPGGNIQAKVQNDGKETVTFCVQMGQTSLHIATIEATPIPFEVQRSNNKGEWGTLMIGPEMGSFFAPVVLDPGKSADFPFRIADSGMLRLHLTYWNGARPDFDCSAAPKLAHHANSKPFVIPSIEED